MLGDFFKDAVTEGAGGAPGVGHRDTKPAKPAKAVPTDPRLDPLAPLPEANTGELEAEEAVTGEADGEPTEPETAPLAESFTSVREEDLAPEARGAFRAMKKDFENRIREIDGLRSGAERTTQYAALLDRIEKDDTLRGMIVGHLQGQQGFSGVQPGGTAAPAPHETVLDRADYPDLDDEEFAVEEAREQRREARFQKRYGSRLEQHEGTVKKVDALMERVEAQREMQELESAHPDWSQHVDPRDLIREKQAQPHRSVRSLYRELDYDKAIARSRRAVFAGGRKSERSVAAAGAGRGSQPPDRIKGINNFADGIAAAIEELGYKT